MNPGHGPCCCAENVKHGPSGVQMHFDPVLDVYKCGACGAPWGPLNLSMEAQERRAVRLALQMSGGQIAEASRKLSLTRHATKRRMVKHHIDT